MDPLGEPGRNPTMKRMIADEWKRLSDEKRKTLRAARSKMGIRCDICGILGYYRENCPNECVSPPSTPGSLDSTPPGTPPGEPIMGLGVLWTNFTEEVEKEPVKKEGHRRRENKISLTNVRVDMNTVRPAATNAMEKMRETDKPLGGFEFFTKAEEGYSRSYAELTLHQVMRRIMRLLERQISANKEKLEASFDVTLLHPPSEKDSEKFYTEELFKIKEYRDYFVKKEMKKDRKPIHRHQAGVRPPDQLDVIFRGAMSESTDDFLFKVDPKAGQSIHGKNTWKSILANNDDLAISDPTMAAKQAALDKQFHEQSKWITMQKRNMEHTNDRFEHIVYILRDQIGHEHSRETKYLLASKPERKAIQMEVYLERLNSVDIMMMCIKSYKFTAGLEEADFLVSCLEKWKKQAGPTKPVAKQLIKLDDDNNNNIIVTADASRRGGGVSDSNYKIDSDRVLIDAVAQGNSSSLIGEAGEADDGSLVTRNADDDDDDEEQSNPQQVIAAAEAVKKAANERSAKPKKVTDTSYSNRMLAASASPYEQDLDIVEEKKVQAQKDSRKRAIVAAEMKLAMDIERAEVAKNTQADREAEIKKKANQKKKWDESRKRELQEYRRKKGTLTEVELGTNALTSTATGEAGTATAASNTINHNNNSNSNSHSNNNSNRNSHNNSNNSNNSNSDHSSSNNNAELVPQDSSITAGGGQLLLRKQSSKIADSLTSKRIERDKRSQLVHSEHNVHHGASAPVLLAHPSHYHHDTHGMHLHNQTQEEERHHHHHHRHPMLHTTPADHEDHSAYHRDHTDGTAHNDPLHHKHQHVDPHGHKVYHHEGAFIDAHYNETKNVVSRTMTHMAELQKEMENLEKMRNDYQFAYDSDDEKLPSTGTMMLQELVNAVIPPHEHNHAKDSHSVGSGGSTGSMAALIAAARASVTSEQRVNEDEAAKTDPLQWKKALVAAKEHADGLKAAAELKEKRRQAMRSSAPVKQFQLKARLTQRQIDDANQEKAKQSFKRAGLSSHIRKGTDEDLAYLAPTLIPVPGAFQSDGSNPLISHTAEKTLFEIKKSMILGVSGYTPQQMLPLYQRNTLMELNGVSSGGDQNYLVMAGDRRYSHYVGRALNRFDPDAADDSTYDIEALARGHTSHMFLESQKAAAEGKTSGLSNAAGKTLPTLNVKNLAAVMTTGESLYGNDDSITSIVDYSSQEYGKGKGITSSKRGGTAPGNATGPGSLNGIDDNSTLVTSSSTAKMAAQRGGRGVAIVAPSRKVKFEASDVKGGGVGGSLTSSTIGTGSAGGTSSKARNKLDMHITRNKAQALNDEKEAAAKEHRRNMRQLAREKEAGRGTEMSASLVRMAFGATLPTLADLAYMEEHDHDDMF